MIIVIIKVLIKKKICTNYNNNNKIIQLKHSKDITVKDVKDVLLCY